VKSSILLAANTAWYLYNFRLGLIRDLVNRGHSVHALVPFDSVWCQKLEAEAVSIHSFCLNRKGVNPLQEMRSVLSMLKTLKKITPDFLFSFTPKVNIYAGICARARGIMYVPNISGLGTAQDRWWTRKLTSALYAYVMKRSMRVFVQNPADIDIIRELTDKEKVYWLPGSGVNIDAYMPCGEGRDFDKPLVVMACRLIRQKGVFEFLDAAESLREKGWSFFLAGISDEGRNAISPSEVKDYAASRGVTFLDNVSDMSSLLSTTAILVLPSYYSEGIPKILIEGAAAGCILVAADNTGSNAVVRDGINGYRCRPRSSDDLARVLRKIAGLTSEEKRQMSVNSRTIAVNEFDERIVIQNYCMLVDREI
jgi:glycosyltransferase involved in cell wall biosynthesis